MMLGGETVGRLADWILLYYVASLQCWGAFFGLEVCLYVGAVLQTPVMSCVEKVPKRKVTPSWHVTSRYRTVQSC